MGKATEMSSQLVSRPLTPAEISERRGELELGDENVVPTLDGRFVRRATATRPAREVAPSPRETWD